MAETDTRLPRVRLQRLVDLLGGTVLEVIDAPEPLDAEVAGVTIFDPCDELLVAPGELILGVGVTGEYELKELIRRLGDERAVALIVKTPEGISDATRAAARAHSVPLLRLTREEPWFRVAVLLHTLLDRWTLLDGTHGEDSPMGDLFGFANAVAALVNAPVIVEDKFLRVLAFSGGQDEADTGRIETVLRLQMPEKSRRILEERRVFRDLYRSREPIFVPAIDSTKLPRVAVPVRAGTEVLGFLWVVVREPLPEGHMRILADAADTAALHILRQRSALDFRRQMSAELLESMLRGGAGAAAAANRLGIGDGSLYVLACQPLGVDSADYESASQRLSDSLALHLNTSHPRAAVAEIGRFVYAVLSLPRREEPNESTRRIRAGISNFVARVGDRMPVVVGIAGPVQSLTDLGRARIDAERTVRALRSERRSAMACFEDVYPEIVLDQLADALANDEGRISGPVAKLAEYDAKNDTGFAASLYAYLDAFGDVKSAAATVNVHPNTFRYRIRRIQEVSGLDLTESRTRLALIVHMAALRRQNETY